MAQRPMASPAARAAVAPPPTTEERIAEIEAQMEALGAEWDTLVAQPDEPDEPEPGEGGEGDQGDQGGDQGDNNQGDNDN